MNRLKKGVSKKTIVPAEGVWLEWKASSFSYTDNGLEVGGLEGNHVSRPDWSRAPRAMQPQIANHPIYRSTLDTLKSNYPDHAPSMPDYLGKFTLAAVGIVVSDLASIKATELESLCKNFLNDLACGPITHTAKVNVNGISKSCHIGVR